MSYGELDIAGGQGRRNRQGRSPGYDGSTTAKRSRTAKRGSGYRTAVFKIGKYARSKTGARNMVDYISRDGDLTLIDDTGLEVRTAEERAALIEEWEAAFPERKDGRYAGHFYLSAPSGSSPENVTQAAREWAAENLEAYAYVGALHEDTANPHYHLVVARKPDGPPLSFGKGDIEDMRESWAEIGTRHGVPMVAQRRSERGLGTYSTNATDFHVRRRDGYTRSDLKAADELFAELGLNSTDRKFPALPELEPGPARAEVEEWAKQAEALLEETDLSHPAYGDYQDHAKSLRYAAMNMREAKTRKDEMRVLLSDEVLWDKGRTDSPVNLARTYATSVPYHRRDIEALPDGTLRDQHRAFLESAYGGVAGFMVELSERELAAGQSRDPEKERQSIAETRGRLGRN